MRMKHGRLSPAKRRPVNLSVDEAVVAEARERGINLSQTLEAALKKELQHARIIQWREENRETIDVRHAWLEQHGLPLDKHRLF